MTFPVSLRRVSGQLIAVTALLAFGGPSGADTARFYDDGLTRPHVMPMGLEPWRVSDTARFYDDGLTRPLMKMDRVSPQLDNWKATTPNMFGIIQFPNRNSGNSLEF